MALAMANLPRTSRDFEAVILEWWIKSNNAYRRNGNFSSSKHIFRFSCNLCMFFFLRIDRKRMCCLKKNTCKHPWLQEPKIVSFLFTFPFTNTYLSKFMWPINEKRQHFECASYLNHLFRTSFLYFDIVYLYSNLQKTAITHVHATEYIEATP